MRRIKNLKLKVKNSLVPIKHLPFFHKSEGFTLVELLAAIMVIGVIGGVVGAILISSLVGTNKTNSLDNVRQNGNYALLQVSKAIEFSRNFYGVSTDGATYTTDCTTPDVSPTPAPTHYLFAKIISDTGTNVVFSCAGSTISSNSASLINDSILQTTSCYFTCSQEDEFLPPTIGVNFVLSQRGSQNFVENSTSVSFNTSVTLRNLNK